MESNSRKYKLRVNINTPYGVGNKIFTKWEESVSGFTGSTNLGEHREFNYENVSLDDLALLSENEFYERTGDFLLHNNVNTIEKYNQLLNESGFYLGENDPNFELPDCQLEISGGTIIQDTVDEILIDGSFSITDGAPVFQLVKFGIETPDFENGWTVERRFIIDSEYTGNYDLWVKHMYYGYDVLTPDCYDKKTFVLDDYIVDVEKTHEYLPISGENKIYIGFDIKYEKFEDSVKYNSNIPVKIKAICNTDGGVESKIMYDDVLFNNGETIHNINIGDYPINIKYTSVLLDCGNISSINSGIGVYDENDVLINEIIIINSCNI